MKDNHNPRRGRPPVKPETRTDRFDYRCKRLEQFTNYHARDIHQLQVHCNRLQAFALDCLAWLEEAHRAIGKDWLPKPPQSPSRPLPAEYTEDPPFDVKWEEQTNG